MKQDYHPLIDLSINFVEEVMMKTGEGVFEKTPPQTPPNKLSIFAGWCGSFVIDG